MSTTVSTHRDRPMPSTGQQRGKAGDSDRSKAENRLGQQAGRPGGDLMLLVTAWPMIQALYLSLFRYRLTTPDDKEFIGLEQLRRRS